MKKSMNENFENSSHLSEKGSKGENACKSEPKPNVKQSFSEILQALNALSDVEWNRRVESVFQSAMREPEKYAFFFGGRKHPLADRFKKVFDSVKLIESTDASSPTTANKTTIIMGALASKRFDKLEEMGLSVRSARQRFGKKTLFCIDTVASSSIVNRI